MNKRAGLFLTSVLALTLTACTAGQGAAPTGPEIARKVRETMQNLNTAEGTIELSTTINKAGLKTLLGDAMSVTGSMIPKGGTGMAFEEMIDKLPDSASANLRVWGESPDKARIEVDSSTLPGAKGTAFVSDGQKVYVYAPAASTLYTASRDSLEKMRNEMKDRRDKMGMPFLQGFDDPEVAFTRMLDATDLRVLGTEKIGDHETYKLEGTPHPDAAAKLGFPPMAKSYLDTLVKGAKGTIWVDKDRWVPLKATFEHPSAGTFSYSGTWKLNEAIDASQFVLQVPPDTKTVDMDSHLQSMESAASFEPAIVTLAEVRDLAQKAGWKLLEPSYLPEGTTLVEVQKLPGPMIRSNDPAVQEKQAGNSFALKYSSPTSDFQINQMQVSMDPVSKEGAEYLPLEHRVFERWERFYPIVDYTQPIPVEEPEVKRVTVRGVDATLSTLSSPTGDMTILTWLDKGNIGVSITGKLTEAEIVKIAEGLQ